jgi:hypothetical protein
MLVRTAWKKRDGKRVAVDGSLRKTFTIMVDEGFSERVGQIAERLEGDWSKADVIRLAVAKLEKEL